MLQPHEITIGTTYTALGKRKDVCTVIDILKTYNHAGEIVKIRYLCVHDFMGQQVEHEECAVTIQRGQ